MSLNHSKSIFRVNQGKILGYIFFYCGISIDSERVVVISNLPTLTSKKSVQDFMGTINFVRRCVLDFIVMVKPIHNLLKQDKTFSCTFEEDKDFIGIKKAIISAPVLAKPNFNKGFIIYTNATKEEISSTLLQDNGQNQENPI
jgi:hypothetical protein